MCPIIKNGNIAFIGGADMELLWFGLLALGVVEYVARAIFGVGLFDLLTLVPEGGVVKAERALYRPHPAANPGDKYYRLYHPD